MPTTKIRSYANVGVDALAVDIEVHISAGLPAFNIVGMAETAVRESRERVRSAILNSKFEFPSRRITVNLAPADLPKQGGGFDLAIAIGVLIATEQIPENEEAKHCFAAELSLTGELRAIRGVLPIAIRADRDNLPLVCADGNSKELGLLSGAKIYAVNHLLEVCAAFQKITPLPLLTATEDHLATHLAQDPFDLSEVHGQQAAKKALELAAAGGHNLLFVGPPGAGKSMLAKRMSSILPNLYSEASLESAAIYSVAGKPRVLPHQPPIRAPHHSASSASLVGGGSPPSPGEVSLAHKGVLFLDELPEFAPKVLEGLREPLENGEITISRAGHQSLFPADFQLIAAMNPCPCGFYGTSRCDCTPERVSRYQRRVSGPLLDRIDMQVQVELPDTAALLKGKASNEESSLEIKKRVIEARQLQMNRQGKINAKLSAKELAQVAPLDIESEKLLTQAMDKLDLSARGLHKVLRVARTIADLQKTEFNISHIKQALSFREQKMLK